MNYTVLVMPRAEKDLNEAYEWLVERTPQHAPEWYNGLLDAILSLSEMPMRHPFCPRRSGTDRETRQMVYGDKWHAFLILYVVRGERVLVTHVRHGSRKQEG